jgi:hypothetical protein
VTGLFLWFCGNFQLLQINHGMFGVGAAHIWTGLQRDANGRAHW